VLAVLRSSRLQSIRSDQFLANANDSSCVSYNRLNRDAAPWCFRAPSPRVSYYVSYGARFRTPTLNELAYKPDEAPA